MPYRTGREARYLSVSTEKKKKIETNITGNMVCDIPPEMAAALVSHLILLLLEKLRQRNKKSTWKMVCNDVLRMLW